MRRPVHAILAPFVVVLALSSWSALAQRLSCKVPQEDSHLATPELIQDLERWSHTDQFVVDGDVEAVDTASNMFIVRNMATSDELVVNTAEVHDFRGSVVQIRGDIANSGSTILLSIADKVVDFDQGTVLVCDISGTDALSTRKLQVFEKCTINGNEVDELGNEIGPHYIRPGHKSDGNEGNEGNEGAEGKIICFSQAHQGYLKPIGINKSLGTYDDKIKFPNIPVAAAVLPNGKILTWTAYSEIDFDRGERYVKTGGGSGLTKSSVYDPKTGEISPMDVSNTQHDMFCPGIAILPNGDIVVTGGQNADRVSVYDISSGSFKTAPTMDISRGYGSTTLLSNGKVFTLGGSWSGPKDLEKDAEIYTPGSTSWNGRWDKLNNIQASTILTDDPQGVYRADNYGWFFAWSRSSVFHAGPSTGMHWFTTDEEGGVKDAGTRPGGNSANGNAIMFDAGKILTFGGSEAFARPQYPAHSDCSLIELKGVNQTPKVTQLPGTVLKRVYGNSVVLPDGKIFATGGAWAPKEFSDYYAHYQPEMWDQETRQWTLLNTPHWIPRTYHSVAVLMHDGRVFTGGGGLCNCFANHLDAEIFNPPYLYQANGDLAPRPAVNISKDTVRNGDDVTVTSSEELMMVAMVRMGSATHSTNTDQRRIELCGPYTQACGGQQVTVQVHGDPGVALPGYWMVFAINRDGVPSEAAVLHVPL